MATSQATMLDHELKTHAENRKAAGISLGSDRTADLPNEPPDSLSLDFFSRETVNFIACS